MNVFTSIYRKYFNRDSHSEFAKNVARLSIGAAAAQVLNLLITPYLTRIYSPDAFGMFTIYTTVVAIPLALATFRYDIGIVTSRSDQDATHLVLLSALVCFFVSIGYGIVLLFNAHFAFLSLSHKPIERWLYYGIYTICAQTIIQVLVMWQYRRQTYKEVARLRLMEVAVFGSLAILWHPHGVNEFMAANLIAQLVPLLYIVYVSRAFVGQCIKLAIVTPYKQVAKQYIEFPKVNILQGFVDMLQMNLVILLLSGAIPDKEMGYLGMCMRILQIPLWLLIRPLANVYFAEASRRYANHDSIKEFFLKTLKRSLPFAAIVPIVLIPLGKILFGLIFGHDWAKAGVYASIMSIWIFFDLLRVPIAQTATILGKQRYVLLTSIVSIIILFVSLKGVIWFGGTTVQILITATFIQSLASLSIIFTNYKAL